jgi:hypothetical protein
VADATTRASIARAYATFFDPNSTDAEAIAALQNGDRLKAAIQEQSQGSDAQQASAKVTSVSLVSSDVATVKFTVFSGGTPLLTGADGNAVRVSGHWQVAAQTFCALLHLQGGAPKACDDPAVTSLPS